MLWRVRNKEKTMMRKTGSILSALFPFFSQEEGDGEQSPCKGWEWLIFLLGFFVAIWLFVRQQLVKEHLVEVTQEPLSKEPEAIEIPVEEPLPPDNLRTIEGIGPKSQAVLYAAGIKRFEQLAALKPAGIKEILTNAGIRIALTETWPQQARLAAKGDLKKLKAYQDTLKGGRAA
jgi:predicted flap endonuclease-1-like 5' DNA nuclease